VSNRIAEPQAAKLVIGVLLRCGGAAVAIIAGQVVQGWALGWVAEFAVLGSVIYRNAAEIRRALGPIRRAWVMLLFALWFVLPLFGKPIVGTLSLRIVIVSLAVPVAEELFFRGWMWSELRKIWPIWATMLGTAVLFTLMHVQIGIGLLFGVVAYTVCRHYCASVRASILLHMINNQRGDAHDLSY
jgi:membrane protease YdiL (CAAX protease family)